MTATRGAFLAAGTAGAVAGLTRPAGAAGAPDFDRAAFEARLRLPFPHRQVFASGEVAGGAVLGFMYNSLNAYETGFGEGPGTLHAAAVLYRNGVALALNDDAWRSYDLAGVLARLGDRSGNAPSGAGNPFAREPRGWAIADLQQRHASFFVCRNALTELARRCGTTFEALRDRLLPGMTVVPAGVAAVNALQEEHFTLFVATD